jgi:predicted PurR-regulated permease PerM
MWSRPPFARKQDWMACETQAVWRRGAATDRFVLVVAVDTEHEEQTATPLAVVARFGAPTVRGVVRLVVIVAACAGALYVLYLTRGVLKIVVIAGFTAMALGPVVDAVQRARVPRACAIVVVYLACALAIVGIGALVVPSIGSQVGRFSGDAQRSVRDLRGNPTVRRYDDRYHLTGKLEAQLRSLPAHAGEAAGPLRDVTVGAFAFISNLIAVLSIAFLLMLDGDRYVQAAITAVSPRRAERWRRVAPQIYRAVSGYVLGNLAISVISGTCAWIAMTLLGVPFALPLAIVIAFFDLIPMVGATLGAIIVALAALLVSPLTAVVWLAYVFVYQQAENYLIQPIVYRRAVQVNPLVTIVAVMIGATLLGLLGALLAIPAAAAIELIIADLRNAPPIENADEPLGDVV